MSDFARLLCSSWRWGVTKNTGDVPLSPSSPYNNLISFLYRQLTFSIITTDFVFH